jgi:tellurite resistance protein TerC
VIWAWLGFFAVIAAALAIDLFVSHRKAHAVGMKEALGWSAFWIALALGFCGLVYLGYEHRWMGLGGALDRADNTFNDGRAAALKFLTGYIVEKSLSVDNLFVIALLFGALAIPEQYRHRILFWGVVGAMALRGVMIGAGAALVGRYHWLLYVFGGLLVITAVKLLLPGQGMTQPGESWPVRIARRWLPLSDTIDGPRFMTRVGGRWLFTPLALALAAVEATDVIFAVDSIPAIFAITTDPFLVFTSNIFALLGLRSLYFVLAGFMGKLRYLKASLSAVMLLIGGKMLAGRWLQELLGDGSELWLLLAVAVILAVGVGASLLIPRRNLVPQRAFSTALQAHCREEPSC